MNLRATFRKKDKSEPLAAPPTLAGAKIHGLYTALLTPFDTQGSVDADRVAELVRFQISKGIDGLYPCGSTGLGPMLTVDERMQVAETVLMAAKGRATVVVQVGAPDTTSTISLAKHAERHGADAVASLTPYYYKPGDLAVRKHFESISKAVGIPLFAYNIPQFTGNNLLPSKVASLARDGIISGIKDSSRDFLQLLDLLRAVPKGFTVMNGIEEYGIPAMMMGASGLVSGGANAYPELFASMLGALKRNHYAEALEAQQKVIDYKEAVAQAPISSYYELLRLRGIDCGQPRPPFLPLDKAAQKKLRAFASGAGVQPGKS